MYMYYHSIVVIRGKRNFKELVQAFEEVDEKAEDRYEKREEKRMKIFWTQERLEGKLMLRKKRSVCKKRGSTRRECSSCSCPFYNK